FYIAVYTIWLKRRTPQNIVIGGAAGALPPVIGWAAATGAIGLEPLILFLIVFLWTPPHFWALSLTRTGDYARAGVPMLPVVGGGAPTGVGISQREVSDNRGCPLDEELHGGESRRLGGFQRRRRFRAVERSQAVHALS